LVERAQLGLAVGEFVLFLALPRGFGVGRLARFGVAGPLGLTFDRRLQLAGGDLLVRLSVAISGW